MIYIKTDGEIRRMRKAGAIVAEVLCVIEEHARPGVSTAYLNDIAEKIILSYNAHPSFKGFNGFPCAICTSINDEVVHGIPSSKRFLKEGDLLKVDVGAEWEGYHADAARTFFVGSGAPPDEVSKLIETTYQALQEGLKQVKEGKRIGDIGYAIYKFVKSQGFSVVTDLGGHGIGKSLWEDPLVPNYGIKGKGPRLREGMTIAIEPMVNMGRSKIYVAEDGWTVKTVDGKFSAHFENTIAVTKEGYIILTEKEER